MASNRNETHKMCESWICNFAELIALSFGFDEILDQRKREQNTKMHEK